MSTHERGPMDHLFERGHVPCDEPPGITEHEYRRWLRDGGQVIFTIASDHIPEPWQTLRSLEGQAVLIAGADGLAFACIMGPTAGATARRLVLCVNTLVGVPTKQLELGTAINVDGHSPAVAELVAAAEDFLRGGRHEGPCEDPFCFRHMETYDRRKDRLELAIRAVRAGG